MSVQLLGLLLILISVFGILVMGYFIMSDYRKYRMLLEQHRALREQVERAKMRGQSGTILSAIDGNRDRINNIIRNQRSKGKPDPLAKILAFKHRKIIK